MENFNNILLVLQKDDLRANQVLALIEILCTKIDINSISGMARSENKTPRGIRISSNYRKFNIRDAVLCVKGLKDIDSNLPF